MKHAHRWPKLIAGSICFLATAGTAIQGRAQPAADPAEPKAKELQGKAESLAADADSQAQVVKSKAGDTATSDKAAKAARDKAAEDAKEAGKLAKLARAVLKDKKASEDDKKAAQAALDAILATQRLAHDAEVAIVGETEKLEIFPFLGFAVDTFSGSEVQGYLNKGVSGDSKTRETFGVNFQYPLYGSNTSRFGVWIYGQTLHGVRSTEFDCKYDQPALLNPKCKTDVDADLQVPNNTALYILRNASTLEAMGGARFEFWNLQKGNAALYVSRQLGFVSVENGNGDVADVNHTALGARIREGRFRNSYIEVGKGTNDLFAKNSGGRFKINARIVTKLHDDASGIFGQLFGRSFFFAHIVADVDGRDGADAVQTYIGLAFCPWSVGRCAGEY